MDRTALRFFYAVDDGGGLGPPPQEIEEAPDPGVLVEGIDEIPQNEPEGDSGYEAMSKEDLMKLVQKNEEEAKRLRDSRELNESIAQGFQTLSSELKSRKVDTGVQQSIAPQQPTETIEQYNERLREEILENPVKALEEFSIKKFGPIINELVGNNLSVSRRFMELDPDDGDFFKKHQEEIDKFVNSLPDQEKLRDKNVYKRATRQIKMEHIDELVESKVQALINKKVENRAPGTVSSGYSESSVNPRPTVVKRESKVLTREEAAKADLYGISKEDYYDYLKRRGMK